jgi:hypothetical protein
MILYTSNNVIFAIISLIIIIFFGMMSNSLNIAVFGHKSMRKMSTFKFLFYLSIVDLCVLIFCTTDALFTVGFGVQVRLYSLFTCRLHTFMTYFLTQLSSVVLTIVSIERVLVICNLSILTTKLNSKISVRPRRIYLNKQQLSTESRLSKVFHENRIEKVLVIIASILAILNIHLIFYSQLSEDDYISTNRNVTFNGINIDNLDELIDKSIKTGEIENPESIFGDYKQDNETLYQIINNTNQNKICFPIGGFYYNYFYNHVWNWIDACIYSFIPFLIMIICSIIILVQIRKKTPSLVVNRNSKMNKKLQEKATRRNNQLLIMLTATNFYFILTSLPYCVTHLISNSEKIFEEFGLFLLIIYILAYSNNSVNIIFYALFSQKYRQGLIYLIKSGLGYSVSLDKHVSKSYVSISTHNYNYRKHSCQRLSMIPELKNINIEN